MSEDPVSVADDELSVSVVAWGLGERLGGTLPPDLRAAVHERLRLASERRRSQPRLLVAALLGVLVVVSMAVLVGRGEGGGGLATMPQDREPASDPHQVPTVSTREQLDALPADTTSLVGVGIEDDVVPRLLRFRRLHTLELRAVLISPLSPESPSKPLHTLSDEGLALIVSLKSLRCLRLIHQASLTARGFASLAQLPRLTELTVRGSEAGDVAFAVVSELPALQSLTLQSCPKLGLATTQRIAGMSRLRKLDLGFNVVGTEALAPLAAMRDLEQLDLPMVGSSEVHVTVRGGTTQVTFDSSVTDELLASFVGMRALRRLDISHSLATEQGIANLRRALPELEISVVSPRSAPR